MVWPDPRSCLFVAAALFVAISATGCIQQMRQDIAEQGKRLDALEQDLEVKRKELEEALTEASRVLRRNSADQGLLIEQTQERIDMVEGQLAEIKNAVETTSQQSTDRDVQLQRRLDEVARAAGMDVPLQEEQIPRSKSKHFAAAEDALRVGNHSYARGLFREYVNRYPKDKKADDAQYYLGVSYLRQGQPAAALGEFRKVLSSYREGDVVDLTLYEMSDAFLQVRDCKDAKTALEALLKNHKKSSRAADARKKLRNIRRLPQSECDQ